LRSKIFAARQESQLITSVNPYARLALHSVKNRAFLYSAKYLNTRVRGSSPEAGTTENAAVPALTDEQVKQKTEDVLEALRDVVDPELGINVVDLGLIYGVLLDGPDRATLDMTLTSAACPLTDVIEEQAAEALKDVVEDFTINWVWMPPWGPEHITDDGREQLRALGFNI
jgi:metal-sulfur cluster biosynthetic enzyme